MLQKVLKKIREVNGLERLEFGCEVRHNIEEKLYGTIIGTEDTRQIIYVSYANHYPNKTSILHWHVLNCEIIGLPIHPHHILKVLPYGWMIKTNTNYIEFVNMNSYGSEKFKNEYFIYYPEKSAEQNLTENPELLNLVAELLNIKQ